MAVVTITSASQAGDVVTVSGTVDGRPYAVQVWASHLATLPTRAARVNYAAQALKAAGAADSAPAVDLSATVNI